MVARLVAKAARGRFTATGDGMTFGERLRQARILRGWSRPRLCLTIKARRRADHVDLSPETIKSLELGRTREPMDTTREILGSVLPELALR